MDGARKLEIKHQVLKANQDAADVQRKELAAGGSFMVDIMGSPGAGKTTLLLSLLERLEGPAAVVEADIASDVDSQKIKAAGVDAVQLETNGVCHVEMGMVERALDALAGNRYDWLFLENIGNLVCPAEFDTGAHSRVMLLSVPEGYDKVYKYPLMFSVVEALIVTKCDYLPLNPDFDMNALIERATLLNPQLRVFQVCARTGEGMDQLADWLRQRRDETVA